jgi:hypothetical protein
MLNASVKEQLIRDLSHSAHEEKSTIARYGRRAAYAARYSTAILREYRRIIRDEKEHYLSFMKQIQRIKTL